MSRIILMIIRDSFEDDDDDDDDDDGDWLYQIIYKTSKKIIYFQSLLYKNKYNIQLKILNLNLHPSMSKQPILSFTHSLLEISSSSSVLLKDKKKSSRPASA